MAKKSAKSKGFRKQAAQKPYLSKKEIAILCVVIVAVAIGAFFLFRYDDGALKVQGGKVVTDGDNWLIVNGSNARGRARYFKLGEAGEIEGFDREQGGSSLDANMPEYVYTPQTEGAVDRITMTCSHTGAEALARYASTAIAGIEGTSVGDPQTAELAGQTVRYFVYTADDTAAEASDGASEEAHEDHAEAAEEAPADAGSEAKAFRKNVSAYIDASHESCVVLHVETSADAAEGLAPDDALLAALEQAVAAVALERAQ